MRPPAAQNGAWVCTRNAGSSEGATRVRLTIGTRPNFVKASAIRSLHSPGHIDERITERFFNSPPAIEPKPRCPDASHGRVGPLEQGLRRDEGRRHHVGGQDAGRGSDHKDVEASKELRPPGAPGIAVERLREAEGPR